jgi:hypothetical protein
MATIQNVDTNGLRSSNCFGPGGGLLCRKLGCPGWQQPMNYVNGQDRLDGGRFHYIRGSNHNESLRKSTIFEGNKINIFKHNLF